MRSGQAHITTAKEYAVIAKERNPNIHVNFIAKEEITILKQRLDEHWEGVLAVPKTHQKHCFILKGSDKVMVADTSEFIVVSIRKSDDSSDSEAGEQAEEEEEEDKPTEEATTEEITPSAILTFWQFHCDGCTVRTFQFLIECVWCYIEQI